MKDRSLAWFFVLPRTLQYGQIALLTTDTGLRYQLTCGDVFTSHVNGSIVTDARLVTIGADGSVSNIVY